MLYSVAELCRIYGASESTFHNHVKKLKDQKKFKKKSMGAKYTDEDIKALSKLLNFTWPLPEDKLKQLLNPKFQTK